jgi:hypothetical protein
VPTRSNLRRNLFWLVFARVVLGTALLSAAVLAELASPGTFPADTFFVLIACTYALSIFNLATLRIAERQRWLIDLQLVADAGIVSAFIFVTGGISSVFSFLYVLPIIAASMVQFRRGGLLVAGFSAVVYVGLVLAQYLSDASLLSPSWLRFTTTLPSPASTSAGSSPSRCSADRSRNGCGARAIGSSGHRTRSQTGRRSISTSSTASRAAWPRPIRRAPW